MTPLDYLARPLVRWGLIVFAFVALVAGFNWWLSGREKAAVEADRTATAAQVAPKVREADERAHEAAQATTGKVERQNEAARSAAEAGTDPLADGLRALR